MSVEHVRDYLKQWNRDGDIIEMTASSATVPEAEAALGVIPARIAKSISLKQGTSQGNSGVMIVVTAGDTKLDNRKFKDHFGFKAKMLTAEEALQYTGHPVGGVCPFGLPRGVEVFLDISMKRFQTIFPACGSGNSAIELSPDELDEYSRNKAWIDVCMQISG